MENHIRFEFATASRIIFGTGSVADVPSQVALLGQRVLVVTDSSSRCAGLVDELARLVFGVDVFVVNNEPDFQMLLLAMRMLTDIKAQAVIGFGGGAAMDTGKAAAALVTNPGDPIDYLEVVGTGRKMGQPSLPFVAIPTTSGTGSEVTRNAVIAIPDKRIKVSLRSQSMLPKLAVVDPGLTLTVPRHITAATGMDALTQLIEPFVCNSPSPFTDSLCRDGIARVARSLAAACNDGQNISARENMSIASLFGGLALANARLGAVHGMANPIGGLVHAPHGAICARLLPLVMKANVQALRKRQPNSSAVDRYTEIASILTGRGDARAEDGVEWVQELCATLNVRPLSEFGLVKKDIPILVENSQKASSMKGNPVTLTPDELIEIIEKAG